MQSRRNLYMYGFDLAKLPSNSLCNINASFGLGVTKECGQCRWRCGYWAKVYDGYLLRSAERSRRPGESYLLYNLVVPCVKYLTFTTTMRQISNYKVWPKIGKIWRSRESWRKMTKIWINRLSVFLYISNHKYKLPLK